MTVDGDVRLSWYRGIAKGKPLGYQIRVYWAWVLGVNPPVW